jgi:putative nucleotidyltransferase with HDIG domain
MDLSTVSLAPAGAADTRLLYLFRASLREGRVHPLLHLLQRYRAQAPATAAASPPAAAAGAGVRAPHSLEPEQVRRRVAELPPLPQAAVRALQTLRREDAALEDVAADLGCDASLTARVLRLANSPFYGVPGRIGSARDAAQVLGRRTLESVLTVAVLSGQFEAARCAVFDAAGFWRHALASAIAARGLAAAAGLDEDQAFVAGLLHDIGLLAMSVYFPDALEALVQRARADDLDLCSVERAHGLNEHAQVGGWIAQHWRFPAPVVQAIAAHHTPPAGGDAAAGIAACVHVAGAIAHGLDLAGDAHEIVPPVDVGAWRRAALDDEAFCRLFDDTESGVRALCSALGL